MSEITQESESNSERYFLAEILHGIFRNLNVKDLCRAAAVSKSWNKVAMHENKRRGLQRIVLPMGIVDVYDSIRVKPCVALMFVMPRNKYKADEMSQLAVLKKYSNYFPNCVVTLGLCNVMMDDELIFWNQEQPETGILSLLIPEYEDLKIRASFAHKFHDTRDVSKFLSEFIPEDSESNATFIIFAAVQYNKKPFLDTLKKCMEQRKQKFNLWGGAFAIPPLFAINHQINEGIEEELNDPDHYIGEQPNGLFAMSMTGSCLKTWSIVIDCSIKKHEFDKKLNDFRGQLQLKRYSIGLACGPSKVFDCSPSEKSDCDPDYYDFDESVGAYTNFSELLQAVRRIITNVSFIGIQDYENYECSYRCYGFKSKTDDPLQELQHKMSFSIMILTYD